jgi:hypothetical protein
MTDADGTSSERSHHAEDSPSPDGGARSETRQDSLPTERLPRAEGLSPSGAAPSAQSTASTERLPDFPPPTPTTQPYPGASFPPPTGQQPHPGTAPSGAEASGAAPAPGEPKRKDRRLLVWLISGGALLVVLVAAVAVWSGVETSAHAPRAAVSAYLDALKRGDADAAAKLGNITKSGPLLTDKVFGAAKDRIVSYSVESQSIDASTATVRVAYEQGNARHTASFSLAAKGKDDLFFTRWSLQPVALPTVGVTTSGPGAMTLTVNGTDLEGVSAGSDEFPAFPGSYTFTSQGTVDFSTTRATAMVDLGGSLGAADTATVQLTAALTDAGKQAADNAVESWVNACIAQPSLQPVGCSFGLTGDNSGLTITNEKWTLQSAPQFTIGADFNNGGWAVATTTPGAATFNADFTESDGEYGTITSIGSVPVQVDGRITGFNADGTAIFQSITWTGADTGTAD